MNSKSVFRALTATCFVILVAMGCTDATVKHEAISFNPDTANPEERLVFAAKDGDVGTLKDLMSEYPDLPTWRDPDGMTLMHHAAMFSQNDVIQFLADNGADVNAIDQHGVTPLAAANDRKAEQSTIQLLESLGGKE